MVVRIGRHSHTPVRPKGVGERRTCEAGAVPLGGFVRYMARLPNEFAMPTLRDVLAVRFVTE